MDDPTHGERPPLGRSELSRRRRRRPLPRLGVVHAEELGQPRKAHHPEGAKLSARVAVEEHVNVYSFTLTIEGDDLLVAQVQDALFEAGCDDATFSVSDGVQVGEFDREARSFAAAVASAIDAVESAVPGARVIEVHRETEVAAAG